MNIISAQKNQAGQGIFSLEIIQVMCSPSSVIISDQVGSIAQTRLKAASVEEIKIPREIT